MMMKKILVTGASGFIGGHVIDELLRQGHEVIATSASPEKASSKEWYKAVTYIPFDLSDFSSNTDYYNFFNKPDILIHLAWEGLPNYKSAFHLEENLPRHYNFLKNLVHNGLKDVTIAGTCFEYGMQEGCLSEDLPAMPSNFYAVAKDKLRILLMEMSKSFPFYLKWARLFYMYGKGQNPNSLLSQLDRALENDELVFNMSGGEQVRDFLPVEKVAEYMVAIAIQQSVSGIINCCSGIPVTVKQFVQNYLKARSKSIRLNLGYYPYADYEPMSFWGNDKILKGILKDNEI